MFTLLATTVLAFGAQDEAQEMLGKATTALAAVDSYTFTSISKNENADGSAGGGMMGGAREPTAGVYKKGLPLLLVNGGVVGYKNDGTLVLKNDEGKWVLFDPQTAFGGGGGGGGFTSAGRSIFPLMQQNAPHEMLADFATKSSSMSHAKEGDVDVFSGELTKEAAQGLAGFGGDGMGGGGGAMNVTGTYRIDVKQGRVVSANFALDVKGNMNGQNIDMIAQQKIKVDKVDAASLKVPKTVMACFKL